MNRDLRPKKEQYLKSEVYHVFNTSVKYGTDRLTHKGEVTAYSQEDADKFAKQRYGKRAIAILMSTASNEKYFKKEKPNLKTRKKSNNHENRIQKTPCSI